MSRNRDHVPHHVPVRDWREVADKVDALKKHEKDLVLFVFPDESILSMRRERRHHEDRMRPRKGQDLEFQDFFSIFELRKRLQHFVFEGEEFWMFLEDDNIRRISWYKAPRARCLAA